MVVVVVTGLPEESTPVVVTVLVILQFSAVANMNAQNKSYLGPTTAPGARAALAVAEPGLGMPPLGLGKAVREGILDILLGSVQEFTCDEISCRKLI